MNRDVPQHLIEAAAQVERLRVVADAELVHGFSGKCPVSGSRQKLVLMHLMILEGQRVAIGAIADRCCIGKGTAWHTIQALCGIGVVSMEGGKGWAKVYRVNVRRLRRLACATPYVVLRPGRPATYRAKGAAA